MLFNTLILAILATLLGAVQAADSCPAGSILGIYAMCGTAPVDCGKGLCCLQGQTCVKGGCTDPKLTDDSGKILTVNAACYGTFDHMTPAASTASSAPASFVTNPSTIATPTIVNVAQSGANSYVTAAPYANGTVAASASAASGTGATSTSSSAAQATTNAAAFSTPPQVAALLMSALAAIAFWL